jgi:hypothetical protein
MQCLRGEDRGSPESGGGPSSHHWREVPTSHSEAWCTRLVTESHARARGGLCLVESDTRVGWPVPPPASVPALHGREGLAQAPQSLQASALAGPQRLEGRGIVRQRGDSDVRDGRVEDHAHTTVLWARAFQCDEHLRERRGSPNAPERVGEDRRARGRQGSMANSLPMACPRRPRPGTSRRASASCASARTSARDEKTTRTGQTSCRRTGQNSCRRSAPQQSRPIPARARTPHLMVRACSR